MLARLPPRPVRRGLKAMRRAVGRAFERRLLGREPITLIAEDCWGGEFCRTLGCAYTTPLAAAFIPTGDYLTFLENLAAPDAFRLERAGTPHRYPVGRTPYAAIHFLHARSWDEVAVAWPRRVARIDRRWLRCKIDFGKPGYTPNDVARWNRLALPHAVAFLPPTPRPGLDLSRVHQGWPVREWIFEGDRMFHLSRRSFDFHHWVRTGRLRTCPWNRALNFLFWDKLVPSELTARFCSGPARSALRSGTRAA